MATSKTDAITLLTDDHKAVKKLFKTYEGLAADEGNEAEKADIAAQICRELTNHAQIEEEIFYPALREALEEVDLIDEAAVEHATVKDLIEQIEAMKPGDDLYDAKVTVLGEYVDHHVREEQNEIFPRAKKKVDVETLGQELKDRKMELQASEGAGGRSRAAPNRRGRRRPEASA